jgi:hypothetical protein
MEFEGCYKRSTRSKQYFLFEKDGQSIPHYIGHVALRTSTILKTT